MNKKTRAALTALLVLTAITPAAAEFVQKESAADVKFTMDKMETIVGQNGFKVFARIDHQAGAKLVKQELRPTELLIFGNPAGGTPLIQAQQSMGLTLPLKVLVWQDADKKVWIGYDTMADLAASRGVPKDHPVVVKVDGALDAMTSAATK